MDSVLKYFFQEAPTEFKNAFSAVVLKLLGKLVDLMGDLDLAKPEEKQLIAGFLDQMEHGT